MSEIIKLYENVRIKKEIIPCPAKYYGYNCTRNNWDDEDCSCDIEGYPPFTAEKQLELIKLLSKHSVYIDYDNGKYEVSITSIGNLRYDYYDTLEETLAYCINNLWQDLSEEEHKQIKEILE